jgi:hypothetical protein
MKTCGFTNEKAEKAWHFLAAEQGYSWIPLPLRNSYGESVMPTEDKMIIDGYRHPVRVMVPADEIKDLRRWLEKNCPGDAVVCDGADTELVHPRCYIPKHIRNVGKKQYLLGFRDVEDAMVFKLTWA